MITQIEIENFKGIADRVTIPIKPITLLFGPNSAGKSTLLHAFHYAREVFERHNLDADRTIAGGSFIDLGGYQNFVHGHDSTRVLALRLELDLSEVELPEHSPGETFSMPFDNPWQQEIRSTYVEVQIEWDELNASPYVKRYEVGLNGQMIGLIEAEKSNVVIRQFDFEHPVFQRSILPNGSTDNLDDYPSPISTIRDGVLPEVEVGTDYLFYLDQADALPSCDHALQVYLGGPAASRTGLIADSDYVAEQEELLNVFSQVFVGMAEVVRSELQGFCYVGPLREKPSREYVSPRFPDPSRWATGLGAWDMLHSADNALITEVNIWLKKDFCLDTGYAVWPKEPLLLDPEHPLYNSLVSYQAFDQFEDLAQELHKLPKHKHLVLTDQTGLPLAIQDVGEGIAQVLPVVVAILQQDAAVVQIEQPELHLHPRQQAALGDLLIRGALGKPRKIILGETHSEHLVLRILRRIRQTANNEQLHTGPVRPEDVAIYYVDKEEGKPTEVFEIAIGEDGEFLQPWPDSFFDQDYEERYG